MHLLHTLRLQHVEISRATAPFTVDVADDTEAGSRPRRSRPCRRPQPRCDGVAREARSSNSSCPSSSGAEEESSTRIEPPKVATVKRTFPVESWIIRMDQPYSRIADALLDRQYWSPDDPQKHPTIRAGPSATGSESTWRAWSIRPY